MRMTRRSRRHAFRCATLVLLGLCSACASTPRRLPGSPGWAYLPELECVKRKADVVLIEPSASGLDRPIVGCVLTYVERINNGAPLKPPPYETLGFRRFRTGEEHPPGTVGVVQGQTPATR
jgi:hypothetical protein